MGVPSEGAALGAPGEARKDVLKFTGAELLPIDAILGNDTIACNLSEHHAQSEDIGGLVELTA